jgi:hypothetical protein
MARTWYHNITQQKFNIQDAGDMLDDYNENDKIMKTVDGCAIIEEVGTVELYGLMEEYLGNSDD